MQKVYGFINRQHLMRNFGISNAQAALDFKSFNSKNPGEMLYDSVRKCYVSTTKPLQLNNTLNNTKNHPI